MNSIYCTTPHFSSIKHDKTWQIFIGFLLNFDAHPVSFSIQIFFPCEYSALKIFFKQNIRGNCIVFYEWIKWMWKMTIKPIKQFEVNLNFLGTSVPNELLTKEESIISDLKTKKSVGSAKKWRTDEYLQSIQNGKI